MLDEICREDFVHLLDHTLTLRAGEDCINIVLKEVRPLDSPSPRAKPAFALTFRAPSTWRAGQGIYGVEHPSLGRLDLFMVPLGPDGHGLLYEVIFN